MDNATLIFIAGSVFGWLVIYISYRMHYHLIKKRADKREDKKLSERLKQVELEMDEMFEFEDK